MKKILSAAALFAVIALVAACTPKATGATGGISRFANFSSNTINPDRYNKNDKASVEITKIPSTVAEFKTLQAKIGGTPEGGVALYIVSMEMYRRDKKVGRECIEMCNTAVNAPSVIRRLDELFRMSDTYYARPYLPASFFQGATPENGYNPYYPYTVQVRTNPVQGYEDSQSQKGLVLHLQVYSDGYDTPWRGIAVVKPWGEDYYRVVSSPGTYTQCKEVYYKATWKPLDNVQ